MGIREDIVDEIQKDTENIMTWLKEAGMKEVRKQLPATVRFA